MRDAPECYAEALSRRRVLLTGAAGGIGAAVTRFLGVAGCRIAAVSRSARKLETLAGDLPAPGRLVPIVEDLTADGAPGRCVSRAVEELGGLDILINNAGIAEPSSIADTDEERWNRHLYLNATVPFLLTRAALPHLRNSTAAAIINVGSVVSHKGYREQGAYAASKHALLGFTKVLARELHADDARAGDSRAGGIRVHFVAPGGVATDMIADLRPDIPREALAQPEEIADLILFLLTRRGNAVIDQVSLRRGASEPWS